MRCQYFDPKRRKTLRSDLNSYSVFLPTVKWTPRLNPLLAQNKFPG